MFKEFAVFSSASDIYILKQKHSEIRVIDKGSRTDVGSYISLYSLITLK